MSAISEKKTPLQVLPRDSGLLDLFKERHIQEKALETLYLHLGKGDRSFGVLRFEVSCRRGQIGIERVGFDKNGEDKFYIVIHKQEGKGGWNQFQIGISRKGTLRAILRPLPGKAVDANDLSNARELRTKLGKNYQGPISRLMNDENGVKVTELGGENLWQLVCREKLSKPDRLTIYKSLMQGLQELHNLGYVHTDLKAENVVVVRDNMKKITGVKIIDPDRMKRIGESHQTTSGTRYFPYSPERLFEKDGGLANPKDDIWAAMCVICDLEGEIPKGDRLLQDLLVEKYNRYRNNLTKGVEEKKLYPQKSLFSRTGPSNLFNNMIFNMGQIKPAGRPMPDQILTYLKFIS